MLSGLQTCPELRPHSLPFLLCMRHGHAHSATSRVTYRSATDGPQHQHMRCSALCSLPAYRFTGAHPLNCKATIGLSTMPHMPAVARSCALNHLHHAQTHASASAPSQPQAREPCTNRRLCQPAPRCDQTCCAAFLPLFLRAATPQKRTRAKDLQACHATAAAVTAAMMMLTKAGEAGLPDCARKPSAISGAVLPRATMDSVCTTVRAEVRIWKRRTKGNREPAAAHDSVSKGCKADSLLLSWAASSRALAMTGSCVMRQQCLVACASESRAVSRK